MAEYTLLIILFAPFLGSIALVFVPPPDTVNVLNYEANLIGQSALVLGAGVALYWWSARRT